MTTETSKPNNQVTLVIDTAHREAKTALVRDGKILVQRAWENTPRVGTDVLLKLQELLDEAGLELSNIGRVAVHAGPGSYSVLRSGIVVAETLAFALGAQLVAAAGGDMEEMAKRAEVVEGIQPVYDTSKP